MGSSLKGNAAERLLLAGEGCLGKGQMRVEWGNLVHSYFESPKVNLRDDEPPRGTKHAIHVRRF
eukprot:1143893-Pelagomonas_calceolata.AAC.23